jgi:hypothetical protein
MSTSEVEVTPFATGVDTSEDELTVSLADGRRVSVPLAWFPRLLNATEEERAIYRLIGGGEGIHWPQLDEDISVAGLLRGSRPRAAREAPLSSQIEYRRSAGTWHWCPTCSLYPQEDYFVRRSRPSGDVCNECASRVQQGSCESLA